MRFEDRFTERAKDALEMARVAASELGYEYVGSEHILLGLAREGGGIAAKVLRRAGLEDKLLLDLIIKSVGHGGKSAAEVQGLTPGAKRIIDIASAEAVRLGHSYVGTEHLLMGIIREYDGRAAKLLLITGADLNKLYTDVINELRRGDTKQRQSVAAGRRGENTETKTLDQFSRDLTEAAANNTLDPVIGRENEIQRVIQILSRRTKNNPVLIGEPGVGKTDRKSVV